MNVPKEYPPHEGGPVVVGVEQAPAVMAPTMESTSPMALFAEAMQMITTDMVFRQTSVLDTPPIAHNHTITGPVFPRCNDASKTMESGLFNDLHTFDQTITESSNNNHQHVLDTSSQMVIDGGVTSAEEVATSSTLVQSFNHYHQHNNYLFLDTKFEGDIDNTTQHEQYDPPMPIVRATSHDHAYVNNQNEDYQILRDFLEFGEQIGVVPEFDHDLLNEISTMDFDDTLEMWGDLEPMIDEEINTEQQDLPQIVDQQSESNEYEDQADDRSNGQFDYSPSPAPSSVFSSVESKPSIGRCTMTSTASAQSVRSKRGTSGGAGVLVKDDKYWERRRKNNVASARSRQTRKEKAVDTEMERERLESRNRQLKEEIARLTRTVDEHKRKFFTAFKK